MDDTGGRKVGAYPQQGKCTTLNPDGSSALRLQHRAECDAPLSPQCTLCSEARELILGTGHTTHDSVLFIRRRNKTSCQLSTLGGQVPIDAPLIVQCAPPILPSQPHKSEQV